MASGKVLERMQQLYSKSEAEVKRWEALQVRRESRAPVAAAALFAAATAPVC